MSAKKNHSPLYTHIQSKHEDQPWGDVLDTGTGWHSLRWINSLPTKSWTAVTVDPIRTTQMQSAFDMRSNDRLLLGDWQDPNLLKGQTFDVLLLDYLIGAIDAFTPYFQDQILQRLKPHAKQWLYIIGLEPTLNTASLDDKGAQLLVELDQLKDACRIHAGKRPYREYPAAWVERRCQEAGFDIVETKHFPRCIRSKYVESRSRACHRLLNEIDDKQLRTALASRIDALAASLHPFASRDKGIPLSTNYVITAKVNDALR